MITSYNVVPHEGTWIEIVINFCMIGISLSFPTRERGLKFVKCNATLCIFVVPHEGTWIEMSRLESVVSLLIVVPHEGTWIEIKQRLSHF